MAERRMFAKTIIDSDAFLDMPLSSQSLYFHLSMRADDDGFINNPRKIQRMIGASDDDLKLLIAKRFIIPFDSGIVVIKHWRIHNYIQKDRYKPTVYEEEKAVLSVKENGAYTLHPKAENPALPVMDTECIQDVSETDTQVSIDKSRSKDNIESSPTRFKKPTLEEIKAYCDERKNGIDPERFYDFYESKGWMVGKNKMKDFRACIRTWEQRDKQTAQEKKPKDDMINHDYSEDFWEERRRKAVWGE